jgi:hypothetical protein
MAVFAQQNSIPDAETDPEGFGEYVRAIAAREFRVWDICLRLLLHIFVQTMTMSMAGIVSTLYCWLITSFLSPNIHSYY